MSQDLTSRRILSRFAPTKCVKKMSVMCFGRIFCLHLQVNIDSFTSVRPSNLILLEYTSHFIERWPCIRSAYEVSKAGCTPVRLIRFHYTDKLFFDISDSGRYWNRNLLNTSTITHSPEHSSETNFRNVVRPYQIIKYTCYLRQWTVWI
jgi:hypothetical protein